MLAVRKIWKGIATKLWIVTAALAVVFAVPRFSWMLNGQYNKTVILFCLMAIAPFVFLSRDGRRQIGLQKPKVLWIVRGFFLGAAAALFVHALGLAFFHHSSLHWFVTIKDSINRGNIIEQIKPSVGFFLLFSLPAMIFSPVGEEFFFRGILHESVSSKWNNSIAAWVDSSFFGITHLAHYGIIKEGGNLTILPSGILWIAIMLLVSHLFYAVRLRANSIWGAVVCHAGFNLAMMGCIFYLI